MRLDDNHRYKLLKLLQDDPSLNQRNLAESMDISLGKVNFCLKALIEQGWIKAKRFHHSHNKKAYAYILTPRGIEEKAKVTARFLRRKMTEFETLQQEIAELRRENDKNNSHNNE